MGVLHLELTIEQGFQQIVVKQHVAAGADHTCSKKRCGGAREEEAARRKERSNVFRLRPSIFLARRELDGLRRPIAQILCFPAAATK
jgi:hypothetical protein